MKIIEKPNYSKSLCSYDYIRKVIVQGVPQKEEQKNISIYFKYQFLDASYRFFLETLK